MKTPRLLLFLAALATASLRAEDADAPVVPGPPAVPAATKPADPKSPAAKAPALAPKTDPGAPTGAATTPAASAAPRSPRFQQVRDRLDVLFQHRNATPPPADARFNPFRTPASGGIAASSPAGGTGSAVAPGIPGLANAGSAPAAAVGADTAPGSDLALLQQSVATLKVSGGFQRTGQQYLVINSRPYKQNDVITTQVQGQPVYLRVRNIAPHLLTLALNDTEMTLKF